MAFENLAAHATTALALLPTEDPEPTVLLTPAVFSGQLGPQVVNIGLILVAALGLGIGIWGALFGLGVGKKTVKKAAS